MAHPKSSAMQAMPPEELPRILYFSRIDFPNAKANSIQTVNTCYELARQGADVLLVVRHLLQSRRDCFAFYGLPDLPRLRFVSLSLPIQSKFNDWEGSYFRFYLASLLRRYRKGQTVVYTRDPAGLELLRIVQGLKPAAGLQTVFEVHKLGFLTKASHQRERGRSLDDERVRAKIAKRRRREGDVYAAADGVVCTSRSAERLLREHFEPGGPVCVVPNGVHIPASGDGEAHVAPDLNDSRRDLDVLYVGQLYRWKGIDGLVRAMVHLPARRLTIVGGNDPDDAERLRALARELGVESRLDLVGYVRPHAVREYLDRAKVGVIPLPHEGFIEAAVFTSPLKAFELMQAGVPIVATDLPSIRELLTDGQNAVLVRPDDAPSLARGIELLLRDRDLAARLARHASAHVLEFSWERRARRILKFLGSLQPAPEPSGA
jgi:glycosyltransferase involved in cell wall biosynthesis